MKELIKTKEIMTFLAIIVGVIGVYAVLSEGLGAKLIHYPTITTPTGQSYEIVLKEEGFTPDEITIKPGDTVRFTSALKEPFWPASDLHPTHGIYPEFDPQKPIEPTSSWTFRFLKTGKWKFHDHLSPYYRGTINVVP